MEIDQHFMKQALKEAKKGLGRTSPNPCVGAVIVRDGEIISRGYHKKAGTPHAEINAIRNGEGQELHGATMYVTLEPCNHTGKTPPCSHALVKAGFSKVVVGMTDPNPLVNGGGLEYLRQHGVDVVTGVLEEECRAINRPFIKHIVSGLPWVVMKAGVSLDGRLNYQHGSGGRITGEESKRAVHKLRDQLDAILIGSSTLRIDNPDLTTRLGGSKSRRGKNPLRVILDTNLSAELDAKVFNNLQDASTLVYCGFAASKEKEDQLLKRGVDVCRVPEALTEQGRRRGLDLRAVLADLGKRKILSVLVEGGAAIHGAFLSAGLYDEAYLFHAPIFAGDGGTSLLSGYGVENRNMAPQLFEISYSRLGDDMLVRGLVNYP